MMKSASINLETIKLHLIQNRPFADHPSTDVLLSKEAVKYLIKALEYADASFTNEIENVLTKAGLETVPALIKGLASPHTNVKSTCAMVLIRLGQPVAEAVQQFYIRNAHRESLSWVAAFILDELREPLPQVDAEEELDMPVLEKVG